MTRGFSLYLDAARALAAFVVLASHLAYAQVSGGRFQIVRDLNVGSDAVIIFFVLSGLVIAHTAATKDRDLERYAVARLSRLWSVALPAIGLSAALCAIGWVVAPDAYAHFAPGDVIDGAAHSILFTNYVWAANAPLPANNPYWSVTYEFWYYVAFGAGVFLTGRARVFGVFAAMFLAGPRIALLAPCWLIGVGLRAVVGAGVPARLGRSAAVALVAAPLAVYAACQAADVPAALTAFTSRLAGGADPNAVFGFSDEFLWNWIIAALTAAHFAGVAALAGDADRAPSRPARAIRWVAARTFSLYLFHMPILQLAIALPGYDPTNPLHPALLAAVILVASFGLAEVTERKLGLWRAALARLVEGLRPRAANAS